MTQKEAPGRPGAGRTRQDTTLRADSTVPYTRDAILSSVMRENIPVFPCKADKTPLTTNGFHDAIIDLEKIRNYWTAYPDALIGMPTGEKSGYWVLDVDLYKKGASEAFDKIILENGPLPKTKTQKTQNGGIHYFFKYRGKIKSRNGYLAKGIDVKAGGGYVCLYEEWDDTPAADAPEWLLKLVTSQKKQDEAPRIPVNGSDTSYGLKALELECKKVEEAEEGTRNQTLNEASFISGKLVADGMIQKDSAKEALTEAALTCGLKPEEIRKTLKSGLNAGLKNPMFEVAPPDPADPAERAKKILRDREPPDAFDMSSIPAVLREYTSEICSRTDADQTTVLMAILCSMSALLGKRAYIPEGAYFNRLYANIWAFVQNSSGSFKTTALNQGCRMAFQKTGEIRMAVSALQKELESLSDSKQIEQVKKSIKELSAQGCILPNKMTGEGLLELLSKGYSGLIPASELGEWLENLGKSHNSGLKALFTDLYDVPQQYSYMTRGGGHLLILRPFISVCGMSTPAWIQDNIKLSDVGSGFFARFLIFTPPQKRQVPPALPLVQTFFDDSCEQSIKANLRKIPDDHHFLLDPEAKKKFEAIHKGLYAALSQLSPGEQELLDPYSKRWSPYVLKLAILFQIAINPDNQIGVEAIAAGAAVVEYAMKSTIHLFKGDLGLSPFQRKCESILKFIAKRQGKVTRHTLLSSRVLEGGAIEYDEVLSTLLDQGKINFTRASVRKYDEVILA